MIFMNEENKLDSEEIKEEPVFEGSPEELGAIGEMMRAGLHYGHRKSKTNPKFRSYIHMTRSGIDIIDLAQTVPALDAAAAFLGDLIRRGGLVLVVATQPAARDAAIQFAKTFGFSYVNDRWVGGLLTNARMISSRIEHFKRTKQSLEQGKFEKYTKKERVMIQREVDRMATLFTGLENLVKAPDALFVIDTTPKGHGTAFREAQRIKAPVVAILDNDDNPERVQYPIPANDHARISIEWLLAALTEKLQAHKAAYEAARAATKSEV